MKKLLILILTASCLCPLPLGAQVYKSTPVTISQEKVSKDGKVYYAHTVLDHQTLFSISRAYGVSYQDILDANPDQDLTRGQIQIGQILMIPQKEVAATEPAQPAAQPAQTAPAPAPATAPAASDFTLYTPKWYETLDMIAAKFNVRKEVLMAYNGLSSDQIAKRQPLRIPTHPETVAVKGTEAATPAAQDTPIVAHVPATQDITPAPEESAVEETPAEESADASAFSFWDLFRRKSSDKIAVSVVLPFNAKGQVNHSSFDLYSGMLLAVRDLAKSGIKTDLSVLDCKNAASPVTAEKLQGKDLIIGPIAPEDLENVLSLCPRSTAVVSPLDPKALALAETYSNFIQAPSPADAQNEDLVDWIRSESVLGDKILLIMEKDTPSTSVVDYLANSGLSYETMTLTTGEARSCAERIRVKMPARGTARAIIVSERETFYNDVIRNLSLLAYKGYDMILYGPSKIRTYDLVEVENLHQVKAHLSCSYFIDYDNPRIKDFLLSYRALFGAEPTQFAYQGYDAATYFIRNFATPERDRERLTRMEDRVYRGLQSDFQIVDGAGKGHVNRAVRRVVYGKDYSISLLNQ